MLDKLSCSINYKYFYKYSFILFAFILPLSKAGVSLFVVIIPIFWIIEGRYDEKLQKIKSNPFLILLFVFIALSVLSLLWTENLTKGFMDIKKHLYFMIVLVAYTSLKTEDIQKIISSFLLGIFVSELISYGVFFELIHLKDVSPLNPSPFMHHIYYSVFLVIASMILLNRIFSSHYTRYEKFFFILFFLSITGNLFLGIGRTGQMIFIIGVIITVFLNLRISFKSILISFVILSFVFLSAYNISSNFHKRVDTSLQELTQISHLNLNGSWGIRIAYWITTYNIILENPAGVGYGDFMLATKKELEIESKYDFLDEKTKDFMSYIHPHNQYLLVVLQTGVIGLVIFLLLIYRLLQLDIKDTELKNLNIIFMIIVIFANFSVPLFYRHFSLALIALFIGLFLRVSDSNTQKRIPLD